MEMTSDGAIYKSSEEISTAGLSCTIGRCKGPHFSYVYLVTKVVTSFLLFKMIVYSDKC